MIRTRDFIVFSGALVFLFTAITTTFVTGSFSDHGQVANVINFAPPPSVDGAESYDDARPRDENIARLRSKIASGEGNVSIGEPVFTSVDDIVPSDPDSAITDQTPPSSMQIGVMQDGQPLMSDELWRFIGYAQFEQVGVSISGHPIYGARADGAQLDPCGGIDEGAGYRLYLQSEKEIVYGCFVN